MSRKKLNIIQTISSSNTSFSYHLLDDNINPEIIYDKYEKYDFDGGQDYLTKDGSEIYRFTQIDKYGSNPIMSHMRISNNGNMYNRLFGIKLGSSTAVYKNEILGVDKNNSLIDYLYSLGFKTNFDKQYINSRYESINGRHINWVYLIKDEVFINLALEDNENLSLVAFEIGLNFDEVNDKLIVEKEGLTLTVEEGIENLYNKELTLNEKYQSGYIIKLKVKKSNLDITPSLFINDELVKKFDNTHNDLIYYYETFFYMPTYDVKIDIRYVEQLKP